MFGELPATSDLLTTNGSPQSISEPTERQMREAFGAHSIQDWWKFAVHVSAAVGGTVFDMAALKLWPVPRQLKALGFSFQRKNRRTRE